MKNLPVRYIKNKDIDPVKWDTCIKNSPNRLGYATSWHLGHATEMWDALVMGDYEFVMPLPVRSKWGIKYVYQPFLCQQLGIFPPPPEKIAEQFYSVLVKVFKYFEIQINSQNPEIQTVKGIEFIRRKNFILPLNMNYAGLFSGYSTNTKRNLKKAQGNKLALVPGISLEGYLDFKSKNNNISLPKKEWQKLKSIIASGQYKGLAKIYGVYAPSNDLCAAAYFCRYGNRATYMDAVSDDKGKDLRAMPFLIDNFIQQNAGGNIILDFEGSMIPGVARFYKGFGAYPETYLHLKHNGLPLPFRWLKR